MTNAATYVPDYRFMEKEIEKFNRRIARIEANPDPTKFRSNVLLYKLQRDKRAGQLKNWKEGKPFMYGYSAPSMIFEIMGFSPFDSARTADLWFEDAPYFFDVLREAGYPQDSCDRTVVPIAALIKGCIPPPTFCVATNTGCDAVSLMHTAVAHQFDVPLYGLDTPLEDTEVGLKYITEQLVDMIQWIEKNIPGAKEFDEDELDRLNKIFAHNAKILAEIYQLRAAVPNPIHAQDAFRNFHVEAYLKWPERMEEYLTLARDELKERVDRGVGAVPNERLRILWVTSAPFYAQPWDLLESKGASVPAVYNGPSAKWAGLKGGIFDETQYKRKLTPLEEQARGMIDGSWCALADRWIQDCKLHCEFYKIDAIVYFMQVGCTTVLGTARILAERMEQDMGIPTLLLEGRNILSEGFNREEFLAKLGDFIDMSLELKGAA